MLAIEWLDKKKIFGDKASIDEMSAFKTHVKKQKPVWDPAVEEKREQVQKRKEQEELDKVWEQEKKKGNVREVKPFSGEKTEQKGSAAQDGDL